MASLPPSPEFAKLHRNLEEIISQLKEPPSPGLRDAYSGMRLLLAEADRILEVPA